MHVMTIDGIINSTRQRKGGPKLAVEAGEQIHLYCMNCATWIVKFSESHHTAHIRTTARSQKNR